MDVSWEHNHGVNQDPVSKFPGVVTSLLVGSLISLTIIIIRGRWKVPPHYPKDIPFLRGEKGFVSRWRACYQGWPVLSPKVKEGYEKVCFSYWSHSSGLTDAAGVKFNRFDQPYILPTFFLRSQVMLPAKDIDWLMRLPETILSISELQNENVSLAHVSPLTRPIPGEKPLMAALHAHVNRHMSRIQGDVYEELSMRIDREFGTDSSQWRAVPVTQAMFNVIQSVGARVVFGVPICRDEQWLNAAEKTTNFLGAAMVSGQLVPWFIQPIISPFIKFICDFVRQRCFTSIRPTLDRWYEQILQEQRDGVQNPYVPYNFATTLMRTALKVDDKKRMDAPMMFSLILYTALLPFKASALTSTATLLDIASSAPEQDVYKTLRKEAAQHLQSDADWNSLEAFANMPNIESVVRESIRLNPTQARSLNREVIQESGLDLPSGQHVPKGTWLGASSMGIHLDDRFYPDAETYKPFRFTKGSETNSVQVGGESSDNSMEPDQLNAPLLSFGGGRHRCAGQAFAYHLNKLLVSYIVTHYDFQPLDSRPPNWEIGDNILPPRNAVINVRRIPGK